MVVALGAAEAQAEEHRADGSRDFVQVLLARHPSDLALRRRSKSQERRRNPSVRIRGGKLVRRELLLDEIVVRLVLVKGVDHIVAVAPHVIHLPIRFAPRRVRVPSHVQPVAAPALPVARVSEQFVHEPVVGFGIHIGQKGLDFVWGWWLSDQVEVEPSHQEAPVGFGCRIDVLRL